LLADRERQADLPDAAGRIDDNDDGSNERAENGVTTKALVLVGVLLPKHATKVTTAAAAVARPMISDVVCVLVEAPRGGKEADAPCRLVDNVKDNLPVWVGR